MNEKKGKFGQKNANFRTRTTDTTQPLYKLIELRCKSLFELKILFQEASILTLLPMFSKLNFEIFEAAIRVIGSTTFGFQPLPERCKVLKSLKSLLVKIEALETNVVVTSGSGPSSEKKNVDFNLKILGKKSVLRHHLQNSQF